MSSVKELELYLAREHPTFHWRCTVNENELLTDYFFVEATINGRPIPHSPMHLSRATLENMGIEATAWLISLELSPHCADVDWDKLAEV